MKTSANFYINKVLDNPLDESSLGTPDNVYDLENELRDVCVDVHGVDCNQCPVYECNNYIIPNDQETRWGCDCFKNGVKMRRIIYNKQTKGI